MIRSFLVKHHSKNSFADQSEALGPPFSKCCVAVDLITAPIPSQGSFPCPAALECPTMLEYENQHDDLPNCTYCICLIRKDIFHENPS